MLGHETTVTKTGEVLDLTPNSGLQVLKDFLWNTPVKLPSLLGLARALALPMQTALLPAVATSYLLHVARVFWFVATAFVFAIGNGIGSGILLTLAADLANKKNPAPFLGAWRFITDSGAALAPMGIAALTAAASLAIAAAATGVAGIVGVIMMMIYVPRFLPHKK